MKIKNLFVGMLAGAAMVACTNEEFDSNVNNAIQTGEKGYVAVNIVAPSATRSTFEPGSDAEVKVTDAVFLFLDKDLNGCANPYLCSEGLDFSDAEGEGLDKEATVLVIDGAKEVPSYIVAVLNPVATYTATTGLADLKAEHATYTTYTTEGAFVMSNAVYKAENGKEVAATPITMANIFSTSDEAKAAPVNIQVERVVAKVEVKALGSAAEGWEDTDDLDDGDKELTLVIDGWDILQNNQSALVKNIDLAWEHTWWNSTSLKRSYWAKDYTGANRNELLIDDMSEASFRYVEETVSQNANTVEADNVNPYLVVAAHFEADGKAISLVEWRGRKYTLDGYLNFIAGNSKLSQYWYKKVNADETVQYLQFSTALLEMVDDEATDWKAAAQLTSEAAAYEYYTCNYGANGKPVEGSWKAVVADADGKSPVAKAVAEFGDVQYWNGGRTYYYTPIKHQTVGTNNFYGVVRNHWYEVTINSISGYGTPVSNPGQAIEIPEKPVDDKSYLAAEVVILDWALVQNEVNLN